MSFDNLYFVAGYDDRGRQLFDGCAEGPEDLIIASTRRTWSVKRAPRLLIIPWAEYLHRDDLHPKSLNTKKRLHIHDHAGPGTRYIQAGKWFINRNTPVGDDADIYERMPYDGRRLISRKDIIGNA